VTTISPRRGASSTSVARGLAKQDPAAGVRSHRLDIQGLRGVAVLVVVLFHAGLLPGGYIGVDVFFVISGFLIGGLLLSESAATGRVDLRRFFARRARRLLPALALVTSATLAMSLFVVGVGTPLSSVSSTAKAASLFVGNLQLYRASNDYFAPAAEDNPLLHTWSLSVEEQFYFVVPMLLALTCVFFSAKKIRTSTVFLAVLAVGALISFALSVLMVNQQWAPAGIDSPVPLAFFGPMTRAWEFAAGVFLAAYISRQPSDSNQHRPSWLPPLLGGTGALLLSISVLLLDKESRFPGLAALGPVVATALLLAAAPHSKALNRFLEFSPLRRIGDVSYGWYLWHWPLIVMARLLWGDSAALALVAASVGLLLAGITYRLLEQPLRRNHRISGGQAALLAAVCIATPLSVGLGVDRLNSLASERLADQLEVLAFQSAMPASWPLPCESRGEPGCEGGETSLTRSAVLVGDSHAVAFAPAFSEGLSNAGYQFGLLSQGGCPFLSGSSGTPPRCSEWQDATLDTLLQYPPSVVVIGGYTAGRVTQLNSGDEGDHQMYDASGNRAETDEQALALYRIGLETVVRELTAANIPVVIVSTVPDYSTSPFSDVTVADTLFGTIRPKGSEQTIEQARRRADSVLEVERGVAELPGLQLTVIDPLPPLCEAVCAQIAGDGTVLYRDQDHLTYRGALRLTPAVLYAINQIVE
jgi:peptidoglycan/LPS O-acetylase OafA/YrhL